MDYNNANAIFIPSDLPGEKTNYTEFKVGFYRTVPANCVLVAKNKLTGRIYTVNSVKEFDEQTKVNKYNMGGFHLVPPIITETIIVPMIDRTIDYPKAEYYTSDGIAANIDIALKVRIVNPTLYIKFGKYQLDQLNVLTQNLLIEYVKKREFNDLSSGRINLKDFDIPQAGQNGGIEQSAYDDFKKRYGIEVKSIQLKSIKLPESLQKLYDDKIEEERKREAQEIKLEAEKQKAEAEAGIIGIKSEAEAKRIRTVKQAEIDMSIAELMQIKDILSSDEMSDSEKIDMMKTIIASKNGSYMYFGGNTNSTNNNLDTNIAQGIIKGNVASDKIRRNIQSRQSTTSSREVTNTNKLLKLLDTYLRTGLINQNEEIERLIELLHTDQEMIKSINELDEETYKICARELITPHMTKHGRNK